MHLRWRILALVLILVSASSFISPRVHAQPAPVAGPDLDALGLATLSKLERHLASRREERQRKDESTAELELENVLRLGQALGLQSLVPLGTALRLEGRQALLEGRAEDGLKRLAQAATLIPDTPGVHYELALAQLEHGAGVLEMVHSFRRGLEARFRGFENRALFLSDLLGVLGSAWLLALGLFLFVQLVRYLDMAGHDFTRFLPGVTRLQGCLLVLLLLAAPVALGMGFLPLLVLGLGLVGLYQTRSERAVTVAGLIGILALAGVTYASAPLLAFRDSDARAIHILATRPASESIRARVEKVGETNAEAAFVLGIDARRRGDLASAESWYRRALAGGRTAPRLNNLGNVLLFLQKGEEAQVLYREAAKLGTHAEPALNLASVLLQEGQSAEARTQADAGRAIDAALAEGMRVDVAGVPAVRKVRDALYDEAVLLPMLLASLEAGTRSPLLDDLSARLLGGIPALVFAAALLLFAIGLLALRDGPKVVSTACGRCGAPAERVPSEPHCDTCRSVFLEVSAADPKIRFKKEQEIRRRRRFERWRERLLSFVAGGGDLVTGHPLVGFTLVFLFSLAVTHVLWLQRYGFYPWPDWSEPESWRLIVSGLIAIPVTLLSLRRGLGS